MSDITEQVRARYAAAATAARSGATSPDPCCESDATSCCGSEGSVFGPDLYDRSQQKEVPEGALLASLGCGNPIAVADLHEGETVLDLGSGGGIDVILSARRVGPGGKSYGLDMTDEMLALAEMNRATAGVDNAEFLKGHIEAVPLPEETVDVVISNCVINLSGDKAAVFAEVARVLRPGGRLSITDVVASDELAPEDRAARGSYVGCIAGALSFSEYRRGLDGAGLFDIEIVPSHSVADGMYSAIVRARKRPAA